MTMPASQYDHFMRWLELGDNATLGKGIFFEYIIQAIYVSILSPGDIAIDGGANRGLHTFALMRSVGLKGSVVAYEPISLLADSLRNQLDLQGRTNVLVRTMALGDTCKNEVLFSYSPDHDYLSGLQPNINPPAYHGDMFKNILVPMVTLDSDLADQAPVRFIKLDLEGGEYHALRGARKVMMQDSPLIVFENHRQSSCCTYSYDKADWFSLFREAGYSVFDIFGRDFRIADWDKSDVPWYSIAAKRPEDIDFIYSKLPHLIGLLSRVLLRHCDLP